MTPNKEPAIINGVCSRRGIACPLCLASARWRALAGTTSPCGDERGPAVKAAPLDIAAKGPLLWAELHKFALAIDGAPSLAADAPGFLARLALRLPCGDCKASYQAYLKKSPPIFGGEFFKWSVALHNSVNAKLGKPKVGMRQARKQWS
jgi:hypothetical protein